jgi:hypothetical protein
MEAEDARDYTLQVWYRGFHPHESGPSYAPSYRNLTMQKCWDILAEFRANTDVLVLRWEISKMTKEVIKSGT